MSKETNLLNKELITLELKNLRKDMANQKRLVLKEKETLNIMEIEYYDKTQELKSVNCRMGKHF